MFLKLDLQQYYEHILKDKKKKTGQTLCALN